MQTFWSQIYKIVYIISEGGNDIDCAFFDIINLCKIYKF